MAPKVQESRLYDLMPILLCGLSVPISICLWLGNLAFTKIAMGSGNDEISTIPPMRWLFSTFAPLAFMLYALKRKGVNYSGAALGLCVAIVLSIASHSFFACLAMFYFTSSRATKYRAFLKRTFEKDFKGGEGKRNWVQVLCNAGMATQLALLYLLDCGSGERPIDFVRNYRASWLGIGVLSAFACSNGDTWASELGSVLSKSDPFLITTREPVPRGTNGGISTIGLIVSLLGGLTIGLTYYVTVIYIVNQSVLVISPVQWPLIVIGGMAGLFGSVVDSLIGATLQYSGIDADGKIVDKADKNVTHISGLRILDNHSVNFISTIITGIVMPIIAVKIWPEI